jgi:hypothetical protein
MSAKGTGLDPLVRLMRHVAVQPDGCWLWTGNTNRGGYGQTFQGFQALGTHKFVLAHRLMYELHKGPIPEGLQLDHLCRVRACVNPEHLEPVTNRENLMRSPLTIVQVKSECIRGHPLSGDNLYWRKSGTRACRTCALGYGRKHRNKVKAAQSGGPSQ